MTGEGVGATKPIRVVLIDAHPIYRFGIRAILQAEPDIAVVGEADDLLDARDQLAALNPTVLVCGVPESRSSRTDLLRSLRATHPGVKVILLAWTVDENGLIHATQSGAVEIIGKDARPTDLVDSIRQVSAGRAPIDERIEAWIEDSSEAQPPTPALVGRAHLETRASAGSAARLSYRELEVLTAVAAGQSNKEIARTLGISDQTVKNHVSSILRTLSVSDRTQAVVHGVRQGWIHLDDADVLVSKTKTRRRKERVKLRQDGTGDPSATSRLLQPA